MLETNNRQSRLSKQLKEFRSQLGKSIAHQPILVISTNIIIDTIKATFSGLDESFLTKQLHDTKPTVSTIRSMGDAINNGCSKG